MSSNYNPKINRLHEFRFNNGDHFDYYDYKYLRPEDYMTSQEFTDHLVHNKVFSVMESTVLGVSALLQWVAGRTFLKNFNGYKRIHGRVFILCAPFLAVRLLKTNYFKAKNEAYIKNRLMQSFENPMSDKIAIK